jgi:hypothetical protein
MSEDNKDGLFVTSVDLGVRNVHLLSGEDVIGHVFRVQQGFLRIETPVIPNTVMDQQTHQFKVGLLPLRPYLDKVKSVDIAESGVIYHVEVGAQMANLYARFVSDIVLATPNALNTILNS